MFFPCCTFLLMLALLMIYAQVLVRMAKRRHYGPALALIEKAQLCLCSISVAFCCVCVFLPFLGPLRQWLAALFVSVHVINASFRCAPGTSRRLTSPSLP